MRIDFKFKPSNVILLPPTHIVPVLHEDVMRMSFENCYEIQRAYKEIIGLRGVTHFSINVIDSTQRMSIISLNPHIAMNICADGSYIYNGSISPSYYNHYDMYSWDESYDPRFAEILKNNMERKNGIKKGIVLVKRTNDLTILYSFASKSDPHDFTADIAENKPDFYQMGDHCYSRIKSLVDPYIHHELANKKRACSNARSPKFTKRHHLVLINGGKCIN